MNTLSTMVRLHPAVRRSASHISGIRIALIQNIFPRKANGLVSMSP